MRIFGNVTTETDTGKQPAAAAPVEEPRRPSSNGHGATEYFATAVALHMQGKAEEALSYLDKARKGGENLGEIYSAMAQIYLERKQHADAAKAYRDLLAVDPDNTAAEFNLALCYEALGAYPEACRAFQTVLHNAPELVDAHLGLATACTKMGEFASAQAAYQSYLKTHADSFAARDRKSVV